MNKILFQRLFSALLVLSFVVALPMQGIATAVSSTASSAPWATAADTQTSDGCDGCSIDSAQGMLCPTVFCIGLTGVLFETPKFEPPHPNIYLWSIPTTSVGQTITPDPNPPRFSI